MATFIAPSEVLQLARRSGAPQLASLLILIQMVRRLIDFSSGRFVHSLTNIGVNSGLDPLHVTMGLVKIGTYEHCTVVLL
jgi:hypothetical protein